MDTIHYVSAIGIITLLIIYYTIIKESYTIDRGIDGKEYMVIENVDSKAAAEMLSRVNLKIVRLAKHLKRKYGKDHHIVSNLLERYNPDVLHEHVPNIVDSDVAYTNNKGDSVYVCLRKYYLKNKANKIHDENTIMFVMLHEVSHIATNAINHEMLFWETFKFILEESVEAGIYDPVDYKYNPVKYCDKMTITYNPLFDNSIATAT